jgi:hypothetical protein
MMDILRRWASSGRAGAWSAFAAEVGGELRAGGVWGIDRVVVPGDDAPVVLDTCTFSGTPGCECTRFRGAFENPSRFKCAMHPAGLLERPIHARASRPVLLDDPLDRELVFEASDPAQLRRVLRPELRDRLWGMPLGSLHIRDDAEARQLYPAGIDELQLVVWGLVRKPDALLRLLELFRSVKEAISGCGDALSDPVQAAIGRLTGPPISIVQDDIVFWSCDTLRRKALDLLGEARDPRAVGPLVHTLASPDANLRAGAAAALGSIGDPSAVPALIPLLAGLGQPYRPDGPAALEALHRFGEGNGASAFQELLTGDLSHLKALEWPHQGAYTRALIKALQRASPHEAAAAALALAEWRVAEALPQVRRAEAYFQLPRGEAQFMFRTAIEILQRMAALPRPASSSGERPETLPVPAEAGPFAVERLPRPSAGEDA